MSTADASCSDGAPGRRWPQPGPNEPVTPYADQMNAIKKYVVSRTLSQHDLTWNNTMLLSSDDPIAEIATLRDKRAATY